MRLEVASYKAVKYACLNYHYAKAIPLSLCAFSVFNSNNDWCGCIVYSSGSNQHLGNKFGLVQGEVCELVRMALNGKQESTSMALAKSLNQLKKLNPILKLVVSYADCDQEHVGTIYQATNWIYEGKVELNGGTPKFKIKGKIMHGRSIGKKGWKQNLEWLRQNVDNKTEIVYTKGKHKYLFPLTKKLKKVCSKIAQAYPKKNNQLNLQQNNAV